MERVSCLVVGAGPTGLALAAQLRSFDASFRVIERSLDRAHESRALAVQARTLEVLDTIRVSDEMVARGNRSAELVIHLGARAVATAKLGGIGAQDTRYPYILFISQAETERVLNEHLAAANVSIERGVELVDFDVRDQEVECRLRHPGGREEQVTVEYLIGCDGAHSAVRRGAGFAFEGAAYPEDFMLGDVEADGPLEPGAINSFVGGGGVAMFFPLGSPTTWRVIAMQANDSKAGNGGPGIDESPIGPLTLPELQAVVSPPTEGSVTARAPAWLSRFRLHHRQVTHYRQGRVFLAGDAAHIHSPVGAQGMNTGIQDAWNLGWKLALVTSGRAPAALLDSYEPERLPVGKTLLQYTDRVFSSFTRAMSGSRIATWARQVVVPHVIPRVLASQRLRAEAFNFVSELKISYRQSPIVKEGIPRMRTGPRAGDRLPDGKVVCDGGSLSLQRAAIGPHFTALLCGDAAWDEATLAELAERYAPLLQIFRLSRAARPGKSRVLVPTEELLTHVSASNVGQYLARPDGYIAFRCGGTDLDALRRYLAQWLGNSTKKG